MGETDSSQLGDKDSPDSGPLTVRLRIGKGNQARELEVSLAKPMRLGRTDPAQDIYPEIDLTTRLAIQAGLETRDLRSITLARLVRMVRK